MKRVLLALAVICIGSLLHACGGIVDGGNGGNPAGSGQLVATHLSITFSLTSGTAGAPVSLTVSALSASGAMVPNYSGTVHFTSSDAAAQLPPDSALTNGTGTFQVVFKTAGSQTVTVSDSAKLLTASTSGTITVTGGSATHFSIGTPTSAVDGTPFSFTVTALDASNNVAISYSGTMQFTSTDSQAVLPQQSALTNGTASFSATLKATGYQTVTATDVANTTIAGTSNLINLVLPGSLAIISGAPPNGTVGTSYGGLRIIEGTEIKGFPLNADGGTPGYTWSWKAAQSSSLPPGLGISVFSSGGSTRCCLNVPVISGTPTATGSFNVVVTATDSATPPNQASSNYSITISGASAAANPVPLINQPLNPGSVVPGTASFTLTVNGTGFVPGSVVHWNGSARNTTFVNGSRVTAVIPANDVVNFNSAAVSVVNPAPGGGTSNIGYFETTRPTSSILLSPAPETNVNNLAGSLIIGDFNADGILDIGTVNEASNTVSVLVGKGDGTFQPAVAYATGSFPSSVAVGDFNGDGKLDLAVTNEISGDVSVLMGNGDGTFQSAVNFAAGTSPSALAVGDFNGDGNLDIAVTNLNDNTVSLLLGNGNGTFQPPLIYSAGITPISVAVGDFDGDGNLDLAVGDEGSANVSILLGNGDGTFRPAASYALGSGSNPISVAVGDLNGDSKLDLVFADSQNASIFVLIGNGDGTFQPAKSYAVETGPWSVAIGDLNGDGKPDLVVGYQVSEDVTLLLGNGDGTFQPPANYSGGFGTSKLVVGDFNGDGRLDIAGTQLNGSALSVMLQPGLISGPGAVLSLNNLTFATQVVGTTSAVQTIALLNNGSEILNVVNISVTGGYDETNNCGSSLPAGGSCTIGVTFTPSAIDLVSGTLTIADNAAGGPQTISLNGKGTFVRLDPPTLRFVCDIHLPNACPPPPRDVTLTNTGSTALHITNIAVSFGAFSQTNSCPATLEAGQSCTIAVKFLLGGFSEGAVIVSDDGGASPQAITLTGFEE
jgi:VCBS repeat protein